MSFCGCIDNFLQFTPDFRYSGVQVFRHPVDVHAQFPELIAFAQTYPVRQVAISDFGGIRFNTVQRPRNPVGYQKCHGNHEDAYGYKGDQIGCNHCRYGIGQGIGYRQARVCRQRGQMPPEPGQHKTGRKGHPGNDQKNEKQNEPGLKAFVDPVLPSEIDFSVCRHGTV